MASRTSSKLDLVKQRRGFFSAKRKPELTTLGPVKYLALAGSGAPESPAFHDGIAAIYAVGYTLKFAQKAAGHDYKVAPLEALWWFGGRAQAKPNAAAFASKPRQHWRWKLLVMVPDFVRKADVERAQKDVLAKKALAAVRQVALERIREGAAVQLLHVGPYAKEPESIATMCEFAARLGFEFAGAHHEIYLSDPRRVSPERLKTLLRMPVRRARAAVRRA